MKEKIIRLPLALTAQQQKIDDSDARFKVVMAGRRGGKTEYEVYWACKQAAKPNSMVWIVAPTYRQCKEIVWRRLITMMPKELIKKARRTELSVELYNNSVIELKGSQEDPDKLRGVKIAAVAMDEAAFQESAVWFDILRAALSDTQGPALFVSTPQGDNWFHKLFQTAKSGEDKEWAAFHYTIYEAGTIAHEEIEKIRKQVSTLTFRQEYLAEVTANRGLVYTEFNERFHVFHDGEFVDYKDWPMCRGMDWAYGKGDDAAVSWIHIEPKTGKLITTDEYSKPNIQIENHLAAIKSITGPRKQLSQHDVLAFDAFKSEPSTNGSSVAIRFRQGGLPFVQAKRNLDLGIDVIKRSLENNFVAISHRCKILIDALKSYEYGKHEPDIIAAWRYNLMNIYDRKFSPVFDGHEKLQAVKKSAEEDFHPGFNRKIRSRFDELAWDREIGTWT